MQGRTTFQSFSEFRDEILRYRAGPLTSPIDEIADDLYHVTHEDELDSIWDPADEE